MLHRASVVTSTYHPVTSDFSCSWPAPREVEPVANPLVGEPASALSGPGRKSVAGLACAGQAWNASGQHRRKWSGLPAGWQGSPLCAFLARSWTIQHFRCRLSLGQGILGRPPVSIGGSGPGCPPFGGGAGFCAFQARISVTVSTTDSTSAAHRPPVPIAHVIPSAIHSRGSSAASRCSKTRDG